MVELVTPKVVGVDVTVVVLTTTVDQDQGVISAHATHGDGGLAGLVAGLTHINPFQLTYRINRGGKGPAV